MLNRLIYDNIDHPEAREVALLQSGAWKMLMQSMARSRIYVSRIQEWVKRLMKNNIDQLLSLEGLSLSPFWEEESSSSIMMPTEVVTEESLPKTFEDNNYFDQEDSQGDIE